MRAYAFAGLVAFILAFLSILSEICEAKYYVGREAGAMFALSILSEIC